MLDLVTIGDIKQDLFVALPGGSLHCERKTKECQLCFAYGEKIPGATFSRQIAGSAPNVAIGGARLGLKAAVVSTMGMDRIAKEAKKLLRGEGVATTYLREDPHSTSAEAVVLNFQGESTQLINHHRVQVTLPDPFPKTRAIHVSELGEHGGTLLRAIAAEAKAQPELFLSINPGVVQIKESLPALLRLLFVSTLCVVNAQEARKILDTTNTDPLRLVTELHKLGPSIAVVTLGADGAVATDGRARYRVPIAPGPRIEATGAGDAFCTGLLAGLLNNLTLPQSLLAGAYESTSVVSAIGPTAGLLTKRSLWNAVKTSTLKVRTV